MINALVVFTPCHLSSTVFLVRNAVETERTKWRWNVRIMRTSVKSAQLHAQISRSTTKPADITTHTLKILSLTRPSKTFTATRGKRHLQTTTQRISSTMHRTTRAVRLENESTTLLRTHITKLQSTFSVPSTLLANKAVEGRVIVSREKNEESNLSVILMVVLAFTMLVILGFVAFIVCERRSNLRRNDVATVERATEHDLAASSLQVQINPSESLL